jgi:molybdopterin synthase catalytic subunit
LSQGRGFTNKFLFLVFTKISVFFVSYFTATNKRKIANHVGNLSKKPLNFNDCKVLDANPIPKNLIQISADSTEIARRLACFVEKKREEIDQNNIQDFIVRSEVKAPDEKEFSCARVDSIIFRQKDSKGHLRVHRVKNEHGPQIDYNYKGALDKLTETKPRVVGGGLELGGSIPGVEERLQNVETHLKVASAKASIFERLKAVEDKILLLETISPEYAHFIDQTTKVVKPVANKIVYSNEEVDELMESLQAQVDSKKRRDSTL